MTKHFVSNGFVHVVIKFINQNIIFPQEFTVSLLTNILIQIIFFKDQGDYVLPCSKVIIFSNVFLKLSMVSHLFK